MCGSLGVPVLHPYPLRLSLPDPIPQNQDGKERGRTEVVPDGRDSRGSGSGHGRPLTVHHDLVSTHPVVSGIRDEGRKGIV